MANSRKKISELPALSVASLDTTFVLGISGSTTYKISINNLTSSLDGAFATDLVTNALSNTLDTKLSTSSFNSYTQSFTASVASGTISGSSQISDLGFVTGSYTTINSFNSLTQSFNSISQSFNVISGSVGTVDFTTFTTTGSNTFIGNQTITGSVGIRANSGSWNFKNDGTLVLPNGTGIYGNGLLNIDVVGGFLLTSYTDQFGSGSKEWYFHSDGILNVPGNIYGASNLATTASFNSYTASQSTSSLVDRLNVIESVSGSWITESETGSFLTSLSGAISSSSQLTSSFDTRYALSSSISATPTLYLLEAYADVTYTLPGSFTEDPCRYSVVNNTVNVSSSWFNTSTYTFTPQKAGYWEITAAYDVYRNSEASMAIKKNNGIVAAAGSFGTVAQQITKIVYLNGSTDFINIVNVGGAANSRSQYAERSWFQARWVGE
jgi:hypothetical protein